MNPSLSAGRARRRTRPLAFVCALSLIWLGVGPPPVAATAPRAEHRRGDRFIQDGERLLRLRASGSPLELAEVLEGRGSVSLSLDRAVFAGAASDATRGDGLVPRRSTRGRDLALLGGVPRAVREAVLEWKSVVSYRVEGSRDYVTTTYSVADDRLSVAIPREVLTSSDDGRDDGVAPPAIIDVNGARLDVDARALVRDREVVPYLGRSDPEWRERELTATFVYLRHPGRLVDAVEGFQRITYQTAMLDLARKSGECGGYCVGCAGGLLGVVGGAAAIGLSCGGAVFTSGLSLALCATAIAMAPGTVLVAAANCNTCNVCLSGPGPDPGPGGSGSEDCVPCPPDAPLADCPIPEEDRCDDETP